MLLFSLVGVTRITLATSFDNWSDLAFTQFAGPMHPNLLAADPQPYLDCSEPFAYTGTAYTTGKCIGGTVMLTSATGIQPDTDAGVYTLVSCSLADYDGNLGDCDLIFMAPDSSTALADHADLNIDYPESTVAWYEIRATPTGDQIPLRNYGADGGKGAVLPNINVRPPYNGDDDVKILILDMLLVARGSFTFSGAGSIWLEGLVLM
jgi:hypothetical protein